MDTTNLIAYLPFDTSTTQDKLGNTWTAYGSPTIQDGALQLDGASYLQSDSIAAQIGSDSWTVHWQATCNQSGERTFFGTYNANVSTSSLWNNCWVRCIFYNGNVTVDLYGNSTASGLSLQYGTSHHYALSYDGTNLRLFVDGVLKITKAASVTLGGAFRIGLCAGRQNASDYFTGSIANFMILKGVAWTENFTPPTDNDYADLAGLITRLYVDVQRKVRRSITPVAQYVSFTGQSGCYGALPLEVLPGATTFTIEVKLATTSTKSSSSNYSWATIIGREIGGNWQNDFGLCVNGGKLCFWDEPSSGGSSSTINTTSDAVINDGDIHKVAVVSSNGAIDLYCDGEHVAHTDNVNAKITDTAKILLAYNTNGSSYLQMDLYEARFWSIARTQEEIFAEIDGTEAGLEAWYIPSGNSILVDGSINGRNATLYGSPNYTCLNTLPVALRLDVARRLKFRYVNKGTADTLIISGTTLTDLPASKSQTGSAFYQTTRAKCFDIPAVEELWIKFDVYFDGSNRWRAYNDLSGAVCGICSYTDNSGDDFGMWQNNNRIQDFSGICKTNQLQTFLLHMISDSTAGVIEAWVDGTKIYTYTGNVNQGAAFADFYLQSDGAGTFFSNVIISNIPIGLHEGFCRLALDVERRIKNRVELSADVQREVIFPIVVPAIGEHFNHLVPSLTVLRDKARRIILPKSSVAYLRAIGTGIIRVFSDTDANGKITGGDFYSSGNMYAALANCQSVFIQIAESVTALQVIKALMQSLNETNLQGTAALDEAINYATSGKFETLAQLTDSFLSDLDNSASYTDFLETYCDIILDNDDTGAITGSDAGGDSIKTRYSIVPEPVPVEDWVVPVRGSSKIIDGLTVHFPLVGADGLTLSDAENHILAGLNSVWIEQSLKLVKDSFAFDFNDAGASVKTINVEFEDDEGHNALASIYHSSSGGKATSLTLTINMHYYANIITTSEDGRSSSAGASYLDRTLAHEFTHAVMAANINYFSSLPTWFKEGSAELVHGIDDVRASTIRTLLSTRRSDLETSLADGTTSNSSDPYAAGFMLLRYLGKQGQVQDNHFAPAALTISNLLISDGATDSNYNALTDNTRQLLFPDLLRTLRKSTALNFDVAVFHVMHVDFPLDVARSILANWKMLPTDNSTYFSDDPSEPIVIPVQKLHPKIDDSSDLQSVQIVLAEQQLTDRVTFVTVTPYDILQPFDGQYLDYSNQMLIESIRQDGILYSCECCSNIDDLLYTQFNYQLDFGFVYFTPDYSTMTLTQSDSLPDEITDQIIRKGRASAHLQKIAQLLGVDEVISHFEDFISDMEERQEDVTYQDLISKLFGWSSRLPQRMINAFLRDGKLYVIQRGHEQHLIDLSHVKTTRPIIEKKLMRTMWGSGNSGIEPTTETEHVDKTHTIGGWKVYPMPPAVSEDGRTHYIYKNVSGYPGVNGPGYALSSTVTRNDDGGKTVVDYIYGLQNGVYACTSEESKTYDADGQKVDEHTTYHHRLTQSQQFSHTLDEDGNTLSSNLSSNLPGFYNEWYWFRLPQETGYDYDINKITGYNPLIDTNFPVLDSHLYSQLIEAYAWLNRRTQETVSFNIYGYPHLIDFNDRIIFNGNVYYLLSNTATTTQRISNEQSLRLVRWY